MSKAVSLSEGGKGRIFPQTDKLKINNVGGGNSLWLPEEEVVTGTLYADENGIYLAENDGFSCYDTVVVRVEDETDPDDPDWELDPDELDEDVWDDESLEEFQKDPEAFEEKYNDKEKWKAEKAKKEKSQKIKKVKSLKPSKITGIDPVDGNPYQVGVDEDGNLTKEMLPSSIHIVVPPWKREYENGEEINFYGMHVYLLDKDGHPFKSEKYPTGEIPFEELLLPVTVADGESGGGSSETFVDVDGLNNPLCLWNINKGSEYHVYWYEEKPYYYYVSELEATAPVYILKLSRMNQEGYFHVYCSTESFTITTQRQTPPSWDPQISKNISIQRTYGGQSAYTTNPIITSTDYICNLVPASPAQEIGILDVAVLALTDGREIGQNTVPVQWLRSDGETLEDSFSIKINPGTNNTPSESDSGSGHTLGGF